MKASKWYVDSTQLLSQAEMLLIQTTDTGRYAPVYIQKDCFQNLAKWLRLIDSKCKLIAYFVILDK